MYSVYDMEKLKRGILRGLYGLDSKYDRLFEGLLIVLVNGSG